MEFQFDAALGALTSAWKQLSDWQDSGACLLAIGTSAEMLGQTIERGPGTVPGIGAHTGRGVLLPHHQSQFVSVQHPQGQLVGFVNRDRGVTWDGDDPVGRIIQPESLRGCQDLLITPTLVATALRGPVLALNPWLADHLLGRVGCDTRGPLPHELEALDTHALAVGRRIREKLAQTA